MEIWSKYNFLFKTKIDEYYLYNAMTNSFLKINYELYIQLSEIKLGKLELSLLDDTTIKTLKKARAITTKEIELQYIAKQKLLYYKSNLEVSYPKLVICPTSACNFECTYCFEDIPNANTMSSSIQSQLLKFINSFEKKQVAIKWFGGEPLLSINTIKDLLDGIKSNDIEIIHNSIITNGYLINKEICHFFNKYNFNSIQITFDGMELTHNNKRVHKKGYETFNKILSNVDLLNQICPQIKINIRFNVDKDNAMEYIEFHKKYSGRWNKKVKIYPAFIKDYTGNCVCDCLDTKDKEYEFISSLAQNNVSYNYYPSLKNGACMANNLYTYIVGPKGELYKCMADFGIEDRIIGNISSEKGTNDGVVLNYLIRHNKYEDPECLECNIFPICTGGCSSERMHLAEDNSIQKENKLCNIRKKFLSQLLELHIPRAKTQK
ncbi:radical SAM/SPASM domain-containing protein [Marinifilum sp. N1E240]|uniref:radical SAM/SPASM domain-containing protein n=1 Tax=Marinifilum sp. N1E240 TaxID=2608082 RepID=UPI00186B7C9E|nr:radical SAM protein [Marinifilum sp. N1E240]